MNDDVIPPEVRQFVLDRIDSVAHLEALLLLRSKPDEDWTCATVASRLYIDQRQTIDVLERLDAGGFVSASRKEIRVYRYHPASADLARMVDRLAEIYAKHLVPVTNLIHSKPKTRVQEFADAFRLRKDK